MLVNLISWSYAKELLDLSPEEKSQIELLIFSCSAEIERFTNRSLKMRPIREMRDGYHQNEITLNQYPVHSIESLKVDKDKTYEVESLIPPEYYNCHIPEAEYRGETQTDLVLIEGYKFPKGNKNIEIIYTAGYSEDSIPEDIKTATVELLEWTIKRLKNHQIGEINLKHGQTTQLETKMPEHVIELLTPYKRKHW